MQGLDKKIWNDLSFTIGETPMYDGGSALCAGKINPDDFMPRWPCPNCWETNLSLYKDIVRENYPCQEMSEMYGEEGVYLFSGYLECRRCGCLHVISGKMKVKEHNYRGEDSYEKCYEEHCNIKYVYPNLRLFFFQDYYPDEVKKVLDRSFSHYFSDIFAATSMLRAAVENLLDLEDLGAIPRETNEGGNLKTSTLHQRIIAAYNKNKINKETQDKLLAIKWVGNQGAHIDESNLDRERYLEIVDIFHYILEELFSPRKEEIEKLVEEINKTRGGKGPHKS